MQKMIHLNEHACIYFTEKELKDLILYPVNNQLKKQIINAGINIYRWKYIDDRLYDKEENYIMVYDR